MVHSKAAGRLRRYWNGLSRAGVERGFSPAWFGYRWVQKESVPDYFRRKGGSPEWGSYTTIHPESQAVNPLPCNISSRDELPKDRGWWGYSFHDVPSRQSGETFLARVPDCRVVPYTDPETRDFWVGILNSDERLFDLREIHFRSGHAYTLRSSVSPVRLGRATWVVERVYHNYSHWISAHLPKFLLLEKMGQTEEILLPPERPEFIDRSLRMLGFQPEKFATFDPTRPLEVEELTFLGTDRFRPELLRMVREAVPQMTTEKPQRRIFISRARAERRRLVNEEEIWPILRRAGFEKISMEDLSFEEQVTLMQETAVLFAPHGAGLTNIVFCAPGTHVVEIADTGFPNPNFYATASAMGHHYWILAADSLGEVHPLEKDLHIDPAAVKSMLEKVVSG